MAAIFDILQIRTSVILVSTRVVLPDLENMGIAVGMSLLSWISAEIYIISYILPVNGRHLLFRTYRNVEGIYAKPVVMPDPENIEAGFYQVYNQIYVS